MPCTTWSGGAKQVLKNDWDPRSRFPNYNIIS